MLSIEKQLRSLYQELVAKEKIEIHLDILKTQGYIVAEKKEQRKIIVGK